MADQVSPTKKLFFAAIEHRVWEQGHHLIWGVLERSIIRIRRMPKSVAEHVVWDARSYASPSSSYTRGRMKSGMATGIWAVHRWCKRTIGTTISPRRRSVFPPFVSSRRMDLSVGLSSTPICPFELSRHRAGPLQGSPVKNFIEGKRRTRNVCDAPVRNTFLLMRFHTSHA